MGRTVSRAGVPLPGAVRRLVWAALIALAVPVVIWYLWYPLAGYSTATLYMAQAAIGLTGLALMATMLRDWSQVGLSLTRLGQALGVGVISYGVILLIGLVLGYTGAGELFRRYTVSGLAAGWLLTGVGEELLFAGALYNLALRASRRPQAWIAVLAVAVLFALWHLPGYLAMEYAGSMLVGRLALNAVSWLTFGIIYALSRNFWLVALAHASTDYPLTPLITENPALGLLFMALLALGGWRFRSQRR